MPPKNQAAWIPAPKTKPFQVGDAPYTPPGPGEIVVKNGAVAINPFDWVVQVIGPVLAGHVKYPFVLGTDVAGTVVEVGRGVTRFNVGDRVLGSAIALSKESNRAAEGGFQLYTILRDHMAAPTPPDVTDEQACVLGLCLGTAAYGLFHKDYLGLDLPQVPPRSTTSTTSGKPRAVIVTGGSSSVGSNAVQLAAAAGYEVLSTSSPKNFAYVKSLGATHVFDYNSRTLAQDLLRALEGRELAGAYAIGSGAVEACAAVMTQRDAALTKKRVALAGSPIVREAIPSFFGTRVLAGAIGTMLASAVRRLVTGVDVRFIQVSDMTRPGGVVPRIYTDFLPRALAEKRYVPAPPPLVVGKGLDRIEEAMTIQMKGVSAQKVVVSL